MNQRAFHYPGCWLAHHGRMEHGDPMPRCEGRLVRVHLIDQQALHQRGLETGDPATYVWACGGLAGVNGHHGRFDFARTLRVPFSELPTETILFAAKHGLTARLLKRYGAWR